MLPKYNQAEVFLPNTDSRFWCHYYKCRCCSCKATFPPCPKVQWHQGGAVNTFSNRKMQRVCVHQEAQAALSPPKDGFLAQVHYRWAANHLLLQIKSSWIKESSLGSSCIKNNCPALNPSSHPHGVLWCLFCFSPWSSWSCPSAWVLSPVPSTTPEQRLCTQHTLLGVKCQEQLTVPCSELHKQKLPSASSLDTPRSSV